METATGYTDGSRPDDLLIKAMKLNTKRKRAKRVVGGVLDNRDKLRQFVQEQSTKGRSYVMCPECLSTYSRGYISTHRVRDHEAKIERGMSYISAPAPKRYVQLVYCPECGDQVSRCNAARHRRETHGINSPRGIHQHYVRVDAS